MQAAETGRGAALNQWEAFVGQKRSSRPNLRKALQQVLQVQQAECAGLGA